jgi:hypothetical protein
MGNLNMSDDLVKRLRVCAAFDPDQAEAADRIEKLEAALGGAYSWIDRWAKHVPNCRAPMRPCTCGRDAVMYEASNALEGKDD